MKKIKKNVFISNNSFHRFNNAHLPKFQTGYCVYDFTSTKLIDFLSFIHGLPHATF